VNTTLNSFVVDVQERQLENSFSGKKIAQTRCIPSLPGAFEKGNISFANDGPNIRFLFCILEKASMQLPRNGIRHIQGSKKERIPPSRQSDLPAGYSMDKDIPQGCPEKRKETKTITKRRKKVY
jgi:hypothetical protein